MSIDTTLAAFAERLLTLLHNSQERFRLDNENFAELAGKLFQLQFNAIPVFRRFCETRGVTPQGIGNWRDIPPIPTRAFQNFELSSLLKENRTRIFFSSGTQSEVPSRHFHSPESLRIYEASLLLWFARHLLSEQAGDAPNRGEERRPRRLLALTPTAQEAPNSSLVHMFETVAGTFSFVRSAFVGHVNSGGAWQLDPTRICEFLESAMADNQPVLVLGTAFSFVHLMDYMTAARRRFNLPPGSRVMETGGYKGRSRVLARTDLHLLITHHLGIACSHLVSEYGMSELSSQAYDHVAGASIIDGFATPSSQPRLFQFPPWARFRIVSPETGQEVEEGQSGLLQVFDLANVYSVMAIQTEDRAVRRNNRFELIGRAAEAAARGCSLMMS